MTCLNVKLELAPIACVGLAVVPARIHASLRLVGGDMRVRLVPSCKPSISGPYLEIEPKILWIADWGSNDVHSNTDWIVQ